MHLTSEFWTVQRFAISSPQSRFEQFRRRFVIRILRDEFAAHGEVEDSLAQLLDCSGRVVRRGRWLK